MRRVFGYSGDGVNGLLGAFDRRPLDLRIEFVRVRHEKMAAFWPTSAKFSGELGIQCEVDATTLADMAYYHPTLEQAL